MKFGFDDPDNNNHNVVDEDNECDPENVHLDSLIDDSSSLIDSDVEVDDAPLEDLDHEENTLHFHEESSFCLKVVTWPYLQFHFPEPITYRGPDAGTWIYFQYTSFLTKSNLRRSFFLQIERVARKNC